MRITGSIRPTQTTEITASGPDRGSAYKALKTYVPETHELVKAHFEMAGGVTTGKGLIRSTHVEPIEAEGESYASANAALEAQIPDGCILLSRSVAG